MSSKTTQAKQLPTIWRVPEALWTVIKPILAALDPPKSKGRKRIDQRAALDAIIFRLRSGCQWNQLPKEFPDDSSVHRTFQRWQKGGVFARIWAVLLTECQELGGVDWGGRPPMGPWARRAWAVRRSAPIRLIAASRA